MKSRFGLTALIAALLPLWALAQTPRFTASSNARQALLNDYFEVTFTLENADGSNFRPPRFTDVRVLSGPNTAAQTSIINGKVSRSVSYGFTLQPLRKGRLVIPSASIEVGGRQLKTEPLVVEIVEGRPAGGSQAEDVFIKAEISSTTAYVGQQLLLDYKLYAAKEVESLNLISESDYDGFYASEVRTFNDQFVREVINGRAYFTRILKRVALYPQRQGELRIEPLNVQMNVPVGDDAFGGFFSRREVRRVPASTQTLAVNVRPLPEPRPQAFAGAVGNFQLRASAEPPTLTTDDALSLRLVITGEGDLKRIAPPALSLGDSFEVYEPKVLREAYTELPDRVVGEKEIEYLITPRYPGAYTLRPSFTYFSVAANDYATLQATPTALQVRPGLKGEAVAEAVAPADTNQGFLPAPAQPRLGKPGRPFWGTPLFWALFAAPLLGLGGLAWRQRRQAQKGHIDPQLLKQQRARQQALSRLSAAAAHQQAGDSRAFYDEVSRALLGYVGDKLGIPPGEMSKANVSRQLQSLGVPEPLVLRFVALLQTCEAALFGGQARPEVMETTYQEAIAVLVAVEEALK